MEIKITRYECKVAQAKPLLLLKCPPSGPMKSYDLLSSINNAYDNKF